MTPSVDELIARLELLYDTSRDSQERIAQREVARQELHAAVRQLTKKENNIEEFCWGRKYKLEQKEPLYIVDKLTLRQGGYSSIHSHQVQHNFMYVLFGKIQIELYYGDAKTLFFERTLLKNESMSIGPQQFHRFKALEDSLVIEIITADGTNIVSRDDIIRLTERGIDK